MGAVVGRACKEGPDLGNLPGIEELLHHQNMIRIAFHGNRVLLSGFARELTGYLDRFSCRANAAPSVKALMVRSLLVRDRILNIPRSWEAVSLE